MPPQSPTISLAFDAVMHDIGLTGPVDTWRDCWDQAQSAYDPNAFWLLTPGALEDALTWIGMSPEPAKAILTALDQIKKHPSLLRLLWQCHYCLFQRGIFPPWGQHIWPKLPDSLGPTGRLFYALAVLSGLPRMRQLHHDRRIPESITRATLADLELWIQHYRQCHGQWGFNEFCWLFFHFDARLYALGRLQYELTTTTLPFRVLRHRSSGRVIAMADAGRKFRADGQFADADGQIDSDAWESHWKMSSTQITGHIVTDRGCVSRQPLTLPRSQWELALQPGDPVLSIHIPASGPMDHDACSDSFRQALDFFPRHFHDRPVKAFICISWLIDPQLADYLPPASNIVRFLQRFQPLPFPGATGNQIFERVFGGPVPDPAKAPRDTALRRIVLDHVQAGRRWRNTAGVILIPHPG